jgi:putative ABC transport system substrate-binding protein
MVFGARAAAGATPIVFNINGDPVEAKLVASLPRPGGTLTGVTALSTDLAGKRIELLKQAAPGVVRMAALANLAHPGVKTESDASHAAARQLGIELQWYPIHGASDVAAAFDAISRSGAGALVAIPDNLINQQASAIAAFSVRRRMPSISGWAEFAEAGNLLSYGPNLRDYDRLVAVYVDKVLRGASPASLPIEQPTEFELVVNLDAAKALQLTVPPPVLVRANRRIG